MKKHFQKCKPMNINKSANGINSIVSNVTFRFGLFFLMSLHLLTASSQVSQFINETDYGQGWTQMRYESSGVYVYGASSTDTRLKQKAFLLRIGKPISHSYQLFSDQEQEAMLAYIAKIEEPEILKIEPTIATKKRKVKKVNHNEVEGPKVVLNERAGIRQVCVPFFEHANSLDWKNHLTCVEYSK